MKLSINNHIVRLVRKKRVRSSNVSDVPRSFQSWASTFQQMVVLTAGVFQLFIFFYKVEKRQLWVRRFEWLKLNFASCVVHQKRLYHTWYRFCEQLRSKPTWLLILSFTRNIVRACSMFYPYEGYTIDRSVTPLDAARVNRTIFNNHSVHWIMTLCNPHKDYQVGIILSTLLINVRHGKHNPIEGGGYSKHDNITWYD